MKKVLITGSAGFIGYHLTKKLLKNGFIVVGIDNINNYYDPNLKKDRLKSIDRYIASENLTESYEFIRLDICDLDKLSGIFEKHNFDIVINLAAQAGVRYSLENPESYIKSNLIGFSNILECCRHSSIEHFLFASSSSVYGMNIKHPFSVEDNTDFPVSLYASTKKSNELLAHSYSHLFNIPSTGLRFFTVYGPYGRPDMAYYKFTNEISNGEVINVFNNGEMMRDFTYVDDVVDAIYELTNKIPEIQDNNITKSPAPFKVFNIGNNNPVSLRRFISAIEAALGRKAMENYMPMQDGDVPATYADIQPLKDLIGFQPSTSVEDGIAKFVHWYRKYYE